MEVKSQGKFTALWLAFYTNHKLFRDGERILVPRALGTYEDMLDRFWITPKLDVDVLSEKVSDETTVEQRIYHFDLRRLGVALLSHKLRGYGVYAVNYSLKHLKYLTSSDRVLRTCPPTLKVMYDGVKQRIRLVGRGAGQFGCSKWFYIDEKRSHPELRKRERSEKKDFRDYLTRDKESLLDKKNKVLEFVEKREILELPVMWTNSGELVCIPQTDATMTYGVVGRKGSGKSFFVNRLLSSLFRHDKWRARVAILNDVLNEYRYTGLSPDGDPVNYELLEEVRSPLPIVNLYPHFKNCMPPEYVDANSFFISLPFTELIQNIHQYLDLGKSGKYLLDVKEELQMCLNLEDVENVLNKIKAGKSKNDIISATRANINSLMEEEVVDTTSKVPAYWKVKGKKVEFTTNPVTACILAGVIPNLVTNEIIHKPYFPQYYKYFLDDIFEQQQINPALKDKGIKVYIVCDEVLNIVGRNKQTVAAESFTRIVAEGRQRRIGSIWCTQNYTKVPDRIRTNTNYLFTTANTEAPLIAKDFNIDRKVASKIKTMDKFEMCGVTSEHFVIYDIYGGKKVSKQPVFGFAIPPANRHKRPDE